MPVLRADGESVVPEPVLDACVLTSTQEEKRMKLHGANDGLVVYSQLADSDRERPPSLSFARTQMGDG